MSLKEEPRYVCEKNLRKWAARKTVPGPGRGAGGEEGCGRGAGVFIKARNAHPRPGSRLPRRRARGFSHISAFSRSTRRRVPSPTPKRRAGAGLPCPDSAGYNPACPSRVPKGRAQDGNRNTPVGPGLSHISAFPAQSVPLPTPKRRAGAGLPCPDSAGYNPACPSRVPKGRAQDGNRNTPVGLGLSHISAFPTQSVPLPTPKSPL